MIFDIDIITIEVIDYIGINCSKGDKLYRRLTYMVKDCKNYIEQIAGETEALMNSDLLMNEAIRLIKEFVRYTYSGCPEQFKSDFAADLQAFHYNCLVQNRKKESEYEE